MTSRVNTDVKKLFEYWCELRQDGSIIESFPDNYRDKKNVADFAFPCDLEGESAQCYSFVLTTDDSKWRFGFCRQDPQAKTAMLLITYLPWHDIFLRLLAVLAELRRPNVPSGEFRAFLSEIYKRGVPEANTSFEIFYNAGQNYFVFERPRQFQLPSIPENRNLSLYYNFVDPKNMIAVFAAMLAERRIIFTSRRLDRLSSCIQAAHAFLYPMVWQHIFIPVLPMTLKDYLSAPMPYLIGVPTPILDLVTPEELGEVVIMNCDTKIFKSPFDDVHELPNEIVSQLKKQLNDSYEHIGDRVSKIFLGALVQLIGTYRDGVEFRESGKVFNRERFIESRPLHLQPFLTKMMDLQIFQQFIDERLEMLNMGLGFSDEFELETARYAEKMKKRGRNYAFLKNVKDKTNPAVKSAVKSVKEGSRGFKTAYKDLKSKFREIPESTNFRSHLSSKLQHDRVDNFQLGKANGDGHRSAPNSPVFNKRPSGVCVSPNSLKDATQQLRRTPMSLATSNSSAHIHPMSSHANPDSSSNLQTPTVSPSSSISSSDMNLSQELMDHPLFKSSAAGQSAKPRQETPTHQYKLPEQRSATYLQLLSTQSEPNTMKNSPLIRAKQPALATTTSTVPTSTPNKMITTVSPYDNSPDMLSPPIPPRQNSNANLSINDIRCDSDCFKSTQRFSSSNTSTISSSSSSSGASFVSAMSSFSHLTIANDTPKPIPRKKNERESLRSLQSHQQLKVQQPNSASSFATDLLSMSSHDDTGNDLISLEDSQNSSFDLEDFDPLNQSGRPFPFFDSGINKTASSISNPIYPYFTPLTMNGRSLLDSTPPDAKPPPLPSTSPPRENDFELLHKYGLDQFKLNTDQAVSNNIKPTCKATTSRKNWTTFD